MATMLDTWKHVSRSLHFPSFPLRESGVVRTCYLATLKMKTKRLYHSLLFLWFSRSRPKKQLQRIELTAVVPRVSRQCN